MFIKWLNSNGNLELLSIDAVSKFVLAGKAIQGYDAFVTTKIVSTGVFTTNNDASRVFEELIRRINLILSTDEDADKLDLVFDVPLFLEGQDWA